MPQARSSGSKSSSGSSSGSGRAKRSTGTRSAGSRATGSRSTGSRATGTRATGTKRTTKSSSSRGTGARKTASRPAGSAAGTARSTPASDPRVEAVAQRIRKLNERIIEASKDAGETTLSSYEKALKAIAGSIERGPGRSDVEWVSTLATTQAKFIRDVTTAWTSAARGMLK
jgi:hypothetical protein